jgi:hypothetical protein
MAGFTKRKDGCNKLPGSTLTSPYQKRTPSRPKARK